MKLQHILTILLVLFCSLVSLTAHAADDIFSTTYGEKWVTIVAKGNSTYYLSYKTYSSSDELCFDIVSSSSSIEDKQKWCLVGSADNFKLYNKAKGKDYVVEAPTNVNRTENSNKQYIGFVSSETNYLIAEKSTDGYYAIQINGTSLYYNLLGGGDTNATWGWNYHVGYWNAKGDNSLWKITEVSDVVVPDPSTDVMKGITIPDGYNLVFSSETADAAGKELTDLTDAEKAVCTGSFTSQAELEKYWEYCPKHSATWCMRMGDDLNQKRENIVYEDGTLKLHAKTSSNANRFLTSGVQMLNCYQYGIFEIKAKCQAHTGNFPALWLMPENTRLSLTDDYSHWPTCGEIDIMEMINTSYEVYGTIHNGCCACLGGDNYHKTTMSDANYHVYTLMWTPEAITWYMDGNLFYTYAKSSMPSNVTEEQYWPFDKPYYLIVNQSVGKTGDWASAPVETHDYEMDIEWVRIYQNADCAMGTSEKADYSRNLKNNWGSICLPFDVSETDVTDSGITFYTLLGKSSDLGKVYLEEVSSLVAGAPYLFCRNNTNVTSLHFTHGDNVVIENPLETVSEKGIQGTFNNINSDDFKLLGNNIYLVSKDKLQACAAGSTVGTFRSYVDMDAVPDYTPTSSSNCRAISFAEPTVTGITEAVILNAPVLYDLQGRRVTSPVSGHLYISNGKKTIF